MIYWNENVSYIIAQFEKKIQLKECIENNHSPIFVVLFLFEILIFLVAWKINKIYCYNVLLIISTSYGLYIFFEFSLLGS